MKLIVTDETIEALKRSYAKGGMFLTEEAAKIIAETVRDNLFIQADGGEPMPQPGKIAITSEAMAALWVEAKGSPSKVDSFYHALAAAIPHLKVSAAAEPPAAAPDLETWADNLLLHMFPCLVGRVRYELNSTLLDREFLVSAISEYVMHSPPGSEKPFKKPNVHIQVVGRGLRKPYTDISHMSGFDDDGVPKHGGEAMRQGYDKSANPWAVKKSAPIKWEWHYWNAQWSHEAAECWKSHIEGEHFKPLPAIHRIDNK